MPYSSFRILYTGEDIPDFEAVTKKTLSLSIAIFAKTTEGGNYGLIRFKTKVKITDVDEEPTGPDSIPVEQQLAKGKYEDGTKAAATKFIDGGLGTDILSHSSSTAGTTIDPASGTAPGGHANNDLITGFENIHGSDFADRLTGEQKASYSKGDGDNDAIASGGGVDKLYGGDGVDTFVLNVTDINEEESFSEIYDFQAGVDKIRVTQIPDGQTVHKEADGDHTLILSGTTDTQVLARVMYLSPDEIGSDDLVVTHEIA